jgi:DNA-binding Xre family transcriptional regulator
VDALHRRIIRNIRSRAKAKGIVITYLPDHAGIGRSSFFAFTAGKNSPTIRWLAKIADALDCDVADLLKKRSE